MISPVSLPFEVHQSAQYGEPPLVVMWLHKGGSVDALWSAPTRGGRTPTSALLHAATSRGHLEMVRELLTSGAAVDLPTNLGYTALMSAAYSGYLSIVLVLLQHSANPDLQDNYGVTALMKAADQGDEACVKALLRAKANTEHQRRQHRPAVGRGPRPHGHLGAHSAARSAAAAYCRRACRRTGCWRARGELSRLATRRDPTVG